MADLTDLGQVQDAFAGADAVVHFAAIPAPGLRPDGETFRTNVLSTYNVFAAAVAHRVAAGRVGVERDGPRPAVRHRPPAFAPIDETIEPRPESSYALSKLVGETMATQFARRSGIGFVGLRISNIMEPDDYAHVPVVLGRRAAAQMEPVGLRRRARRRRRPRASGSRPTSTAPRSASWPPPTRS